MKRLLNISILALMALVVQISAASEGRAPIWKLDAVHFDSAVKEGDISLDGTLVYLNGANSLTLPQGLLGKQQDFTIEFEVQRPQDTEQSHRLTFVSNMVKADELGFELIYFPPSYNASWLMINGHRNDEKRGFLKEDDFQKVTLVVKDRSMMMFRDGMLLTMTSPIDPSPLPLRFGKVEAKPTQPYPMKDIAVYDYARLPDGFDSSTSRMRSYSGDMYNMQRVEINDPDLPRILVIGDSHSMGYRTRITKALEGRAYVDYWTQGYWHQMIEGENSPLERALTGVISQGPYDLISFNFGAHSWGRPERSPEDKYHAQHTKLLEHIQKMAPDTKLLWIRTTPRTMQLEDGTIALDTEKNARIAHFNDLTDPITIAHGIPMVDLYGLSLQHLELASKDGVHWNREMYDMMGDTITEAIEEELNLSNSEN